MQKNLIFLGVPDTQDRSLGMFFRQKKNRSGVISVQVIDKSSGKYRLVKTIGSSSDAAEVAELVRQAETWIKERQGQLNLDFSGGRLQAEQFLEHITQIRVEGVELLLGGLFEQIKNHKASDWSSATRQREAKKMQPIGSAACKN